MPCSDSLPMVRELTTDRVLSAVRQAHLVDLAPTPFLRTFAASVIKTIPLAGDDINELTLREDGHVLGWAGDEGRLGVGQCPPSSRCHTTGADISALRSRSPDWSQDLDEGQAHQCTCRG